MKLQDVILKAMAKKIGWLEAAEIIVVCDRTMRRMRDGYQKFGYTGLMDRRRGKPSVHRAFDLVPSPPPCARKHPGSPPETPTRGVVGCK
jgi:hypothetical protein